MNRKIHCVIMGGGRGTRLYPLTKLRCKPAVPLAGKYRLVDIPISNCINSGYNRIYLLSQFNTASLHRHVQDAYRFDRFGQGFVDILSAEQTEYGDDWYQGTADAVRRNLIHFGANDEDIFVILSGDQLYRMDFSKMVNEHIERGAEITVAAKLGDKDPDMNPRLRTAIQAAKQANMPKDNISRAISKSEMSGDKNYESLRYEGFGPANIALIIETLTDNKNRSASSIRTVLQKKGGRLGETGSTSHMFFNCGVLHINKDKIKEDELFEIAINAGAKDCLTLDSIFEVITEKEDFYKVKIELEKKIDAFEHSSIEWRPLNYIELDKDQSNNVAEVLTSLEDLDDVQNIFTNANLKNLQ